MKRLSLIASVGALTLCFVSFSDVQAQSLRKTSKFKESARTTQEAQNASEPGVSPLPLPPILAEDFNSAPGTL